jgi:transposase InsO family protein
MNLLVSRVIIDCVGPLPKTKSGSQYLLTIMCASTRFPEAIPLRNIKAKTIVKALVKFFIFVGSPKSVQSDQGSNFMSGNFQQVMHELGITQCRSSAYHPESQCALERFHQTLKNMIRSYYAFSRAKMFKWYGRLDIFSFSKITLTNY